MNSENIFSTSNDKKQNLSSNKNAFAEFTLTYDQYVMLQHYLPKKYALLEYKPTKRNLTTTGMKFAQNDNQNLSRMSGNFDNTDDLQGRSKRQKHKKIDRFLQNDAPQKVPKRAPSQRANLNLDEQMMQCYNILTQLKKHKSAYPFLQPVDPKLDGAYNYLEIIKQPMDLSTVQNNLKNNQYQTAGQFHGDINKIWLNSYAYNEKSSPFYKLTIQMEKYYKHLCTNEGLVKKERAQMTKTKPAVGKEPKSTKKESVYDKNSEKQQHKSEKKSVSGGNDNAFGDSDDFVYDK